MCGIHVTALLHAIHGDRTLEYVLHRSTFRVRYVKDILSIMFTCGMYDYSGHWAYRVGIPAKSGVGGGVIAIVNRQLGITTYSPRLDRYRNRCRGAALCVELASQLGCMCSTV